MSELGKKMNLSGESEVQPMGGGCGLSCSSVCSIYGAPLCKCKNNKMSNKGTPYYSKRNSYIAKVREPTTV